MIPWFPRNIAARAMAVVVGEEANKFSGKKYNEGSLRRIILPIPVGIPKYELVPSPFTAVERIDGLLLLRRSGICLADSCRGATSPGGGGGVRRLAERSCKYLSRNIASLVNILSLSMSISLCRRAIRASK